LLEKDTFYTIALASDEVIYKEKGSKFIGYAYPITNEDEVKDIIDALKSQHPKARHWCYAWQLGIESIQFRVNDDGEPNNSAGQPIYGQILSRDLTNILVVVVRYFGGTKLGVGGLVNAYKSAAQLAIDSSKVVTRTIKTHFVINFEYRYMNHVMRIIKEKKAVIVKQKMDLQCEFEISVRKKNSKQVKLAFQDLRQVKIEEI
jgi:uncharacterized YigZ family protein